MVLTVATGSTPLWKVWQATCTLYSFILGRRPFLGGDSAVVDIFFVWCCPNDVSGFCVGSWYCCIGVAPIYTVTHVRNENN